MTDLPLPPIAATVDLRNYPGMLIQVQRLRDSDLRRRSSGDEFKAGLLLWCAAWHQVPCGSLPDDNVELADFACIGTGNAALRAWEKIRPMALRGWILCSDQRLYHPLMVEQAKVAWASKQAQRERTMKARLANLAKMIANETDPVRSASLKVDYDRVLLELSEVQLRTLSQPPVTAPVTSSKGSDRIRSDLIGGGVARDARDPVSPHPLASLLASHGLASDPTACAEWVALMHGPVVGIPEGGEFASVIKAIMAQARRDNPGIQYARHCAAAAVWWAQRRDQREAAKNRPPTPLPEPEVPRETPQEACARRLRGELNPIERPLVDGARAHVGPAGEWIKGPKIADWMYGTKPDPVAAT